MLAISLHSLSFAADSTLERGLAAYAAQDYAAALQDLQPLAAGGDPQAQFTLSWMYRGGNAVALDYAEAARLLRLAADAGHGEAQMELSTLYFYGLGVRPDIFEGAHLLELASAQGVAAAQQRLAVIYLTGSYQPMIARNDAVGMRLMQLAIDQQYAPAMFSLAEMYYLGQSDFVAAEPLFRRAAELGHADSMYYLGTMYSQGQWLMKDLAKASMWLQLASANGNRSSVRLLEELRPEMTAAQLQDVESMSANCLTKEYKGC